MSPKLNLTPTRLKALQYLASKPAGVYVSALADEVLTSQYRQTISSGFKAQRATQAGAGCAVPLIRAGLVHKQHTTYGWGIVSITDAGLKLLADHPAAQESVHQSLDDVIARCVDARVNETP
jgi:hypothetical protein